MYILNSSQSVQYTEMMMMMLVSGSMGFNTPHYDVGNECCHDAPVARSAHSHSTYRLLRREKNCQCSSYITAWSALIRHHSNLWDTQCIVTSCSNGSTITKRCVCAILNNGQWQIDRLESWYHFDRTILLLYYFWLSPSSQWPPNKNNPLWVLVSYKKSFELYILCFLFNRRVPMLR